MYERREFIAEDYEIRAIPQNERLGYRVPVHIKSRVLDVFKDWVDDRNDICHQPGYIQTIAYDSFDWKTKQVLSIRHEHKMDVEGRLRDRFSMSY